MEATFFRFCRVPVRMRERLRGSQRVGSYDPPILTLTSYTGQQPHVGPCGVDISLFSYGCALGLESMACSPFSIGSLEGKR